MPADEWLTPQDLAAELHLPIQTLYQWRSKALGPRAHRIGRHLRYRRRDVEAWLDRQATAPAPDAA
jgi:predicted DNA-binding transcriptional regulator AlpA